MNQNDIKDLLASLVSIHSVAPQEKEITEFVENYLLKLGFSVEWVNTTADRVNLVASSGMHERYLGFYGHLDTVKPADGYTEDPYTLRIEGDKARGLGAYDMKGGICAILLAAKEAIKNNLPMKIVLGVDEENYSQGANDLVVSPLLTDIEALISADGSGPCDLTKPFQAVFGRRGRAVFNIEVKGDIAHAAEVESSKNAIVEAARLVGGIASIAFPECDYFGATHLMVEAISSDSAAYSNPSLCEVRISALSSPGTSSNECMEKLLEYVKVEGFNASVKHYERPTPCSESFKVDTEHPFVKDLIKSVLAPDNIRIDYSRSVADENVFANNLGIPVVSLAPIGNGMHQANEWVSLTSIERLMGVYEACLKLFQRGWA